MFKDRNLEDVARESLRKAEIVEDLVKHPGWQIVQEVVSKLMTSEISHLSGQKLDSSYYKKIGFLQSLNYLKAIDSVIKDKEVREFLLSQGRLLGYETFLKIPQYFFEGRSQMSNVLGERDLREKDGELKDKFISQVYQQS